MALDVRRRRPLGRPVDRHSPRGHARHAGRGAWTSNTVKDIWRRREVYVGRVIRKRGLEVNDGQHEPLITEDEYRDATAGINARRRCKTAKGGAGAKRVYLLRGLVDCDCGAKMRGETRVARGKEWRYYACPVASGRSAILDAEGRLVECHAGAVRADLVERAVVEFLTNYGRSPEDVDRLADEVRSRLAAPAPDATDKERTRLKGRLAKLADLYSSATSRRPTTARPGGRSRPPSPPCRPTPTRS